MFSNRITHICLVLVLSFSTRITMAEETRTWSDITGSFKIEAKFVSATKDKVKLQQPSGKLLEIDLKKLSVADQKYVETLKADAENPFKTVDDNPFMPVEKKGTTPAKPTAPVGSGPREVKVDLSSATGIPLEAQTEEWNYAGGGDSTFSFKPKTVLLPPKRDFFEGLKKICVSEPSQRMAVGYVMGARGRGTGTSRVQLCDLRTGKILSEAIGEGEMVPIALHDDGEQILMRRSEFGFGKSDRLEVWTIRNKEIQKGLIWTPYEQASGADRDVMWARFLDDGKLATSSRKGKVVIWDFATATPICYFDTVGGAVPDLSHDRKTIAFCAENVLGLFDVESQTIQAIKTTPGKLQWPYVAFSPSGNRLACIAQDEILVWDAKTGDLQKHFSTPGISIHGEIDYPHDDFLLANNQYLIDLENQLKLWHYQGGDDVLSEGGVTFFASTSHRESGAVMPIKIPHPEATDLLDKALTQPDLFVFREGTTVQLDVSKIPAEHQSAVKTSLTNKLKEMNCQVADSGTITLVASVTGPKQREISYHFSGDYTVNEFITKVEFNYQGKPVWSTQSTNVPGFIMLKKGENIEGVLRKAGEQANYKFFDGVVLPKFLQKPSDNQGVASTQTLGSSRVTARGAR